jgi:protease-4
MKRLVKNLVIVSCTLAVSTNAFAQFDMFRKLTQDEKPKETTKQIAHFKIKGQLKETPSNLPPLFGSEPPQSLKGLLERFKEARRDNNVVAVVVDLQQAALGFAQLQEIHKAMRKLVATDKEVYVHADSLRTMTYAVATGASHVSIVPTGDVWLVGLYGETPYLRSALDKLGCVPDIEQCGDFKSAGEPLMRTEPSDESRRMSKWLIDGLYDNLVNLIAESRDMTPEKVQALIDGGPYSAEEALQSGLIDSVKHRQDFIADIKKQYGANAKFVMDYGKKGEFEIPDDNFFAMFEFIMKMFNPTPKVYTEPSVAVVYVEGAIQTGVGESSPFGPAEGAFSTSIRKALDKAAQDKSVKAVVLRVNSPGGSALASEIILDAARRVAEKKPLIVSMGNVAASGGYYVSCAAEAIFADPGTITASIGVIGGKIVTSGMWDKLGINWHATKRGDMAGMLSTASPFSDAERKKIRHYMTTVYDVFKKHVTDARGEKLTKPIDEIAGGRVFTGAQAMELGLVDAMGGLDDTIKYAAKQAKISEYEIRVIPEPANIFDLFMGGKKDDDFASAAGQLDLLNAPLFKSMLPIVANLDPLRANAIVHALKRIELLHQEHVVAMMPVDVIVR